MIQKQLTIGLAGLFLLLVLSCLVSAHGSVYNYYDGHYNRYDNYDRYSYHSVKESGGYYGMNYARTVDYDKMMSSRRIGYGGWETTTKYTKTVREYPGYNNYRYGGYYGGNYGGYYGSPYRSYYYDW